MRSEVISLSSAEAQKILRDFRIRRSDDEYVAELTGDGFLTSAAAKADAKIFIRYFSYADWIEKRASFTKRWLQALRLRYLSVSWLPMLLALVGSHALTNKAAVWRFTLALLSVSLLQFGAQLWNDYEDHIRGIDLPGNGGGSGVIQKLWIPALHIKVAAICFLLFGCGTGALLLANTVWPHLGILALMGIVGALGAASYSGWPWHYKYLGLGEFIVFFLTGPLLCAASGYLVTQELHYLAWFAMVGIPLGMLTCLRLHIANVQKIPFDTQAGSRTLANSLSFVVAKKLIFWSMLLPYLALSGLVALDILPARTLIAWVSIPIVAFEWRLVRMTQSPLDPALHQLRLTSAWQQLAFGLLYLSALLV